MFIAFGLRLKMARLFKIVGYGSEHVVGPSRSDAIAMLPDLRNDLPSFTWRPGGCTCSLFGIIPGMKGTSWNPGPGSFWTIKASLLEATRLNSTFNRMFRASANHVT